MKPILGLLFTACASVSSFSQASDLVQARNQHFAQPYQQACQIRPTEFARYAGSADEATQHEVAFKQAFSHQFALNQHGEAYLQLATLRWDEKFIVMLNKDVAINIAKADVLATDIRNHHCEAQERVVHHFNTHEWGSYTLQIRGNRDQNIWLTIVPEEPF
ncbi:hypothetical protein [Vibrio fluvialis]|uniref:hypothetical protein n=1 Tax=Vibrio fluvialis TaxID=676 RepID=UPI0028E065AB|nr:hypothetical protein [Vibrio fluvialis]MDT8869189.1 hypothetical protein [Vibrio fluvialis]MDT8876842.1 hypothetical protein [Vibrio fluvialis]